MKSSFEAFKSEDQPLLVMNQSFTACCKKCNITNV